MIKPTEIAHLDATAQAALVRGKQVTSSELVEAAIANIEALNPRLNAVVTPMFDEARRRAHAIDSAPDPRAPFAGVPFLLKDLMGSYAGVRHTFGSAFLEGHIADHDAELVVRHKRAGLIVLGKTNTPELGILPTTEPHLFGPSRNPWNTERTTGGSSGGSAAAVAAGMVPMAHANDGGGSIRIPASCCGLFGLKPTRARNPLGPDVGDAIGGLVAEHAVTRTVRDSAALLDATAGPDVGDPYWAPPIVRPFVLEVGAPAGRLRIALSTRTLAGTAVHPDCIAAAHNAAQLCESLGHDVDEASPQLEDAELLQKSFLAIWASSTSATISGIALLTGLTPTPDQFEPLTWALKEMGEHVPGSQYALGQLVLQSASRQVARFMLDYDVILTPTLGDVPTPLGHFDSPADNPLLGFERATIFVPYTPLANITGQPAMSVPLYWNAQGLPIGTHFVGRFGDEATLFRLAAQLEAARPWANRWPPLSAMRGEDLRL